MATTPPPPVPQAGSSATRVQAAVERRAETDYIFDFWTALGWTILTCGIYAFYILYRMMWRSVNHNRRRIELLDSVNAWAWEKASAAGRDAELTPAFERVAQHIAELRRLDGEFRDPIIWVLIDIVSGGIGGYVAYVLLDMDLVDHERAERGAEAELSAILSALGASVSSQAPMKVARHNWLGRVLATLATCGLYGFWWIYDIMRDGNENYRGDWWWEDQLQGAVGQLGA
jgi:hypothetical protein